MDYQHKLTDIACCRTLKVSALVLLTAWLATAAPAAWEEEEFPAFVNVTSEATGRERRGGCDSKKPHDIHYYLINMDISVKRLLRFRENFEKLGLRQLERVAGVLIKDDQTYEVPRNGLKRADFGVAMAHREVWKRFVASSHEWAVVFEDDAMPFSTSAITDFPEIPTDCIFTQLSAKTSYENQHMCGRMDMIRIGKGWSTAAYLMHRDAAQRLLDDTKTDGFRDDPLDMFMIYRYTACVTNMHRCDVPILPPKHTDSLREFLNGEVGKHNDFAGRRR